MLPGMVGAVGGKRDLRARTLVIAAGLGGNLALCLDAGDINSWPGSGQLWLDASGSGRHFTLGASASAASDDPTFVGNVNGMGQEYFSFDGADGIRKETANDTFFNSLHKSGWDWTSVAIMMHTADGVLDGPGLNTRTSDWTTGNTIGVAVYKGSANRPATVVGNGSAQVAGDAMTSVNPMPANTLLMAGVAARHNGTTNRDRNGYVNGTYEATNSGTSFTPTASNSAQAMYGLTTDNSNNVDAGHRLYAWLMFNKMLSQAEFDALRTQFQKRWAV